MTAADRVVACDGAAREYRRRFRKWPEVIVGDLDSLGNFRGFTGELVRDAGQDDNDLDKALTLCRLRGWNELVVVGATGKREDHTIGNVFRALAAQVELVADDCVFLPVCGTRRFRTTKGMAVSVFAIDPRTKMTSRGLEWPLDGVRFVNPYCATLNRATGKLITVTSNRPAYVCLNFPKQNQ